MATNKTLPELGWSTFFQQQVLLDEWTALTPARVSTQHRSHLELLSEQGIHSLEWHKSLPDLVVGDWVLLDEAQRFRRVLDRQSVFSRKAPGRQRTEQLIAANVDTVFVVCSLNENFNLNRIERYLAVVREAGAEAVVVLSKADCCEDVPGCLQQVQTLGRHLWVEAVNAMDINTVSALASWCQPGQTIALLGSSGVGKSTLVNTLMGQTQAVTGTIREADDKGRHTTTTRALHFTPSGAILMDTPGMRELQIAECEQGVQEIFGDVSELASQCRFVDCQHDDEPGCAVQAAIEAGQLNARRLQSYTKLLREQAFNSATLNEKRARDRNLSRHYRSVQSHARKRKSGKAPY